MWSYFITVYLLGYYLDFDFKLGFCHLQFHPEEFEPWETTREDPQWIQPQLPFHFQFFHLFLNQDFDSFHETGLISHILSAGQT